MKMFIPSSASTLGFCEFPETDLAVTQHDIVSLQKYTLWGPIESILRVDNF